MEVNVYKQSILIVICCLSAAMQVALAGPSWTCIDLGANYYPNSINPALLHGVGSTQYVVGTYSTSSVLGGPPWGPWDGTPFYMVKGTSGWPSPTLISGTDSGYGTGVNDYGYMCGTATVGAPPTNTNGACLWTLTTVPPSGGVWSSYALNGSSDTNNVQFLYGISNVASNAFGYNANLVAGYSDQGIYALLATGNTSNQGAGMTWSTSPMGTTLGSSLSPIDSYFYGINNVSPSTEVGTFTYWVAGSGGMKGTAYSGYAADTTQFWNAVPFGSGYLGGSARSINSGGTMAGYADNSSGVLEAYVYTTGNASASFLGTNTPSEAFGINDAGDVVGTEYIANQSYGDAFVYTSNGIIDLNSVGYVPSKPMQFVQASAVNNDNGGFSDNPGYIIGYGIETVIVHGMRTNVPHGFLLIPAS